MNTQELELVLIKVGIPKENLTVIKSQLEKRARQLAEEKGQTYEEAIVHLINLMQQGWAAKQNKK